MPKSCSSESTRRSWLRLAAALLLCAVITACGGGDGSAEAEPAPGGEATLGAAGGTVESAAGARVVVPAGALDGTVTVRLARDATDMPALPAHLSPVGDVWTLTPHGANFSEPVQVSLPPPVRALADNETLRMAKISPGGTWELLTPEASAGALSVNVLGFSYFVPVVETYPGPVQSLPALELVMAELLCNGGNCEHIMADSAAVTLRLLSNRGRVPQGCASPQLRLASSAGTLSEIDPVSVVPTITAGEYRFSFRLNTSAPRALVGTRGLSAGELSVQLVCAGPPETRTPLAAAPVRFPAITVVTGANGLPGVQVESAPALGMAAALLSCNGDPCTDLVGPQDVRLAIRMTPGPLPAGCTLPARVGVKRNYNQPLLADSAPVPASGTPLTTPGGYFPVGDRANNQAERFRIVPPVPARAEVLYFGLLCANGSAVNGGHVVLNFVTPQQPIQPAFTTQPRSMAVRVGQTASFTAVVSGFPTPTLQWMSRGDAAAEWSPVAGATSATFTTALAALADNGRQYKLVASNALGNGESQIVTLTVQPAEGSPVIGTQPAPLAVITGSDAAFAVVATGTGALSYEWRFNGSPIPGANAPVLKLVAAAGAQAGRYSVVVSNAVGSVTSSEARLDVSPAAAPAAAPTVTTQPAPVNVGTGNTATFAVGVAGTGPFGFQWRKDGTPIDGATAAAYTISAATAADEGMYTVLVTNSAGSATSSGAKLTVSVPVVPVVTAPQITTQPATQVGLPGGSATFAVAASGTAPLAYQWVRNGTPIAGATGPVLNIGALNGSDAGEYTVAVSNAAGSVASNAGTLIVVGAPAISASPASISVVEGGTARFSVAASGSGLRYLWLRDGLPIAGATEASTTTAALTLADSGTAFSVIVYNGAGVVLSEVAVLTVAAAPVASPAQSLGKIAMAYQHSCAITAANAVACWGYNSSGQIGRGDTANQPTPFIWNLPEAAVQVAAGAIGSCAVTVSGQVWCSGGPTNSRVPTRLAGFSGVRQVTLGSAHACLLQGDGTVWCWGNNSAHQFGDGGTTGSATPVQVQDAAGHALTGVLGIDAGDSHTCAMLDDNGVRCWGVNEFAQSGSESTVITARATVVAGASYADHIAAGANFTCLYSGESSSVMCWGLALDGSNTFGPSPQESGPAAPVAVGAGSAMACAIDDSANVWCWGTGVMGNGNVNQTQDVPTKVSGLSGAVAVAGGLGHTCVLRSTGALVCWGSNGSYQLGTGDPVARTTPTEVPLAGGFWRR